MAKAYPIIMSGDYYYIWKIVDYCHIMFDKRNYYLHEGKNCTSLIYVGKLAKRVVYTPEYDFTLVYTMVYSSGFVTFITDIINW